MKLARVFCFLVILGSSAAAAYAQTPVDPGNLLSDPRVVFNAPDPACGAGLFCVDLTFTGTPPPGLFFGVPGPAGSFLPDAPPSVFSCISNVFAFCVNDENQAGTEFFGFSLFGAPGITSGETFTLSSTGPILLTLPTGFSCNEGSSCSTVNGVLVADLTPEPGTALLFMSGLIFVVGLGSKRFRAESRI
jgi:hypothetical protein